MSKITVITRRIYGVLRMYPACKLSHAITSIKMAPTLTNKDIESLIDAGLEVEIRDSETNNT